jgi:hypothetical protein
MKAAIRCAGAPPKPSLKIQTADGHDASGSAGSGQTLDIR